MKLKVKKMFEMSAKKFGTVKYEGVELALRQNAYPVDWSYGKYFHAAAMDREGNLWDVIWYPESNTDYVANWDKPDRAVMVDKGYYLVKY